MESESKRAKEMGYDNPILSSLDETHDNYNAAIEVRIFLEFSWNFQPNFVRDFLFLSKFNILHKKRQSDFPQITSCFCIV
jgi:hypothetical protein